MTTPVRLQRSRAKGSRLVSPNGLPVVCVTRPGKWGNPFTLPLVRDLLSAYTEGSEPAPKGETAEQFEARCRARAIEAFRDALLGGDLGISVHDVRRELRGKNIACWCGPLEACHGDVLLALANEET